MSAAEALRVAHAAGVTVMFDGEGLVLEANTEPPMAVLMRSRVTKSRYSLCFGRVTMDGPPSTGERISANAAGLQRLATDCSGRRLKPWRLTVA
jgi:hypothetical protein